MNAKKTIVGLMIVAIMAMPVGTVVAQDRPMEVGDGCISCMPYYWYEPGDFEYENGVLSGTYLDLELDENTGTIEDYTLRFAFYDMMYPALLYQESAYVGEDGEVFYDEYWPEYNMTFENITIFESMGIDGFTPNGHPGTFGDMFLFQGENMLFQCYDYEGAWSSYLIDEGNVTFTFEVADGFNVSKFDEWYLEEWEEWEDDLEGWDEDDREDWESENLLPGDAGTDPEPPDWADELNETLMTYEVEYYEDAPYFLYADYNWDEVWIEGHNTSTSIYINNGTATIENNTITIEVGSDGSIDISSWVEMPYFDHYLDYWDEYEDWEYEGDIDLLEGLIEVGRLAASGDLFVKEDGEIQWSDTNTYDDPTFQMEFKDVNDEYIEIEVDSRIPTGRIVSVNLNDAALDISCIDELLVKLDNVEIRAYDSLEALTELIGGPNAGYYVLFGENGNTVFVYVPHFSTHTITLEAIAGAANVLVPALLAIGFIALMAVAVVKRAKKGQDDY